jgi:uncharacterized membrane protein YhaH (DUF805 family)
MLQIFGISGRIGRGTWWMVQIGTMLLGFALNYAFVPDLNLNQAELEKLKQDPEMLRQLGKTVIAALPFCLGAGILSHWLFITSSIQRLHDRGSGGWRVVFAYLPLFIFFGSLYAAIANGSWGTLVVGSLLFLAGSVLSLVWLIVECGMMSGEDCENDYGDPPNAAARKAGLEAELRILRGEPEPPASFAPAAFQAAPTVSQPIMNLAGSGARPTFGRR